MLARNEDQNLGDFVYPKRLLQPFSAFGISLRLLLITRAEFCLSGEEISVFAEPVIICPYKCYHYSSVCNEQKYVRITVLYFCWIGPNRVTLVL